MKKALILGVTGQDGSYMAELLIKKKYKVYGFYRKAATSNTVNIDHLINDKKIFNKKFFLIWRFIRFKFNFKINFSVKTKRNL